MPALSKRRRRAFTGARIETAKASYLENHIRAVMLAVFDSERLTKAAPSPTPKRIGAVTGLYVVALCAVNLISAVLQCNIGACHTTGYKLL